MKTLPIPSYRDIKPNFKGYFVEHYGCKDVALRTGRRIENTVGTYRPTPTGKVYYADPLEKEIPDNIKEQVDYIVYDDEPALSDIDTKVSLLYFFPPIEGAEANYSDELRKFREYYYRLEMMDRKTIGECESKVWQNIDVEESKAKIAYFKEHVADAQYNQETAGEGDKIYNESRGLRDAKNKYYYEMQNLDGHIKNRERDLDLATKELKQREELDTLLKEKIAILEKRRSSLNSIKETYANEEIINKKGIDSTQKSYDKNNSIMYFHAPKKFFNCTDLLTPPAATASYENVNGLLSKDSKSMAGKRGALFSQIRELDTTIGVYKEEQKQNKLLLDKVGQYKVNLPEIIKGLREELVSKTALFEKAKADLIPHFERLKNHFLQRGVRVIK